LSQKATIEVHDVLESLPAFPRSVVAFIIVLGVLVFIHELGHYLAARWRRVHVETFSIGFGRALLTWRDRRATVWKIGWVPLGGYVRLHGQERPEDVAPEVRATWIPGQTFNEKSVLSRAIIVAAGPLANFALAALLFFALYASHGRPVLQPTVGEVLADSAAARAGLQQGDRITGIDSQPIDRFEDIQRIVLASPGKQLVLHVMRADSPRDVPITPDVQEAADGGRSGKLGIRGGGVTFEPLTVPEAAAAAVAQTWDVTVQTIDGVWGMITRRNTGEDFGGPLRIAQMSGEVATLGLASLVSFIALLSVNLGLINLFPIPVLDGGHLMFFLAEAVRGKPLPPRAQEYGFRAGFALLIGLFAFATFKDLGHIGVFRWVASLIG
jgi:regulator of sigma E protease